MSRKRAGKPTLEPGMRYERAGREVEILEVNVPIQDHVTGEITFRDGIRYRFWAQNRWQNKLIRRGEFERGLKPVGYAQMRRELCDSLLDQAREIMKALGDEPAGTNPTVFAAKMDRGEQCVQLILSASSVDQLHRVLTGRDDNADLAAALGLDI